MLMMLKKMKPIDDKFMSRSVDAVINICKFNYYKVKEIDDIMDI